MDSMTKGFESIDVATIDNAGRVRDIVVGIPSYNEARTIRQVVETIDAGLRTFFPHLTAAIVNADSGSDDGTSACFLSTPTTAEKIAIDTGSLKKGKGRNIFAVLRFARATLAKAACLFDADVRTISPDWVDKLLSPALGESRPALISPIYTRNKYEGNTTNHIVVPLLYAVFGRHIRQPIAGEFAMNREFIRMALDWPSAESALLYGIDIFLTANALARGLNVAEVRLSRKLHNPGFPKILHMSQQVLDTLMRILLTSQAGRVGGEESQSGSQDFRLADHTSIDAVAETPKEQAVNEVLERVRRYLTQHDSMAAIIPGIVTGTPGYIGNPSAPNLPAIDAETWCNALISALGMLTPGNFFQVRDQLVAIYLCRVMTYWGEINAATPAEIEQSLYLQASLLRESFLRRRPLGRIYEWESIPFELRPGPWDAESTTAGMD